MHCYDIISKKAEKPPHKEIFAMKCYVASKKQSDNAIVARKGIFLCQQTATQEQQQAIAQFVEEFCLVKYSHFDCWAENDGGIDQHSTQDYVLEMDSNEVVLMDGQVVGIYHDGILLVVGESEVEIASSHKQVGGWGEIEESDGLCLERKDGKKVEIPVAFRTKPAPRPQLEDFEMANGVDGPYLSKYNGSATELVVPEHIRSIGYGAFKGNATLKKVVIPNSVKSIAMSAFENCTALEEVVLPTNTTFVQSHLFEGCTALKHVDIPEGYTSIGSFAFANSGLQSICLPQSLKEIERASFFGCKRLKHVEIPKNCGIIDGHAFAESGLQSICIPNGVHTIGDQCFDQCRSLQSATMGKGIQKQPHHLFADCTALVELHLPKAWQGLRASCIAGCTSLQHIYFDGTKEQATNLQNIVSTLPQPVELHTK